MLINIVCPVCFKKLFFSSKLSYVQKKIFQTSMEPLVNTMGMNFPSNFLRTPRVCFPFAALKIFLSTSFGVILFHFLLQVTEVFSIQNTQQFFLQNGNEICKRQVELVSFLSTVHRKFSSFFPAFFFLPQFLPMFLPMFLSVLSIYVVLF